MGERVKFCVELTRKPGTINANQQQRMRRIHVTAKDSDEAIALAKAEAKRTGIGRFFEIERVRKI